MKNDTCHFPTMDERTQSGQTAALPRRAGRPRRGTELARTDTLIGAATRVFLREGYGDASIDKVAHEAGVSTRTIYERFKNKADLLAAVITRLVDRDMATVFATAELERMEVRQALIKIGETITGRARDPEAVALFRIVATEAQRFPALAANMRRSTKVRFDEAVASYLRTQIRCGKLVLDDPDRAAALFLQMVCAELHECLLFGPSEEISKLDFGTHLNQVVNIFLNGAIPRSASAARDAG
jgi:TetR/AcrR family transcriptional regulator, mexJK operon transcriptional repressor